MLSTHDENYLLLDIELKKSISNNKSQFSISKNNFESIPNSKQDIISFATLHNLTLDMFGMNITFYIH